jgi:putative transposase
MKKSKFSDEQIVHILREAEEGKATVEDVARKHGVTTTTFYRWKRSFGAGGVQIAEARRVKELEMENGRLKKALAEQLLAVEVLKEINAKKW